VKLSLRVIKAWRGDRGLAPLVLNVRTGWRLDISLINGRFIPWERALDAHWISFWTLKMVPIGCPETSVRNWRLLAGWQPRRTQFSGLDASKMGKVCSLCRISNHSSSVVWPVSYSLYLLSYPDSRIFSSNSDVCDEWRIAGKKIYGLCKR
jgi:hypothetical protein